LAGDYGLGVVINKRYQLFGFAILNGSMSFIFIGGDDVH
jgi:hypothetical protein